ncbi:MAG: DUF2232 domain-containing protein [Alphaproteobacteria bacterium]
MTMLMAVLANIVAAGLLVFPAVVTVMTIRRGPQLGLLLVMLLVGLAVTAAGLTTGLSIAFGFSGVGLALWYYGKRFIRLERLFGGVVAAFVLGSVGVYFAGSALTGVGPVESAYHILGQIRFSFDAYLELLRQSTGSEQLPQIQSLEAARLIWVWTFFKLMPSLLVVAATGLVLVNILLVRHVLPALLGLQLNRWRAPDQLIWAVLIPGLGLLPYLIGRMRDGGTEAVHTLFFISLNLVIIGLLPYMIQGLAVMAFFLERWRLPRLLRGLTYFLVLTQGLAAVVAALGLMEFWTDFRGRALAPKKEKTEEEDE